MARAKTGSWINLFPGLVFGAAAQPLFTAIVPGTVSGSAVSADPVPGRPALAHEALTQLPTSLLTALLRDPVDALIARQALERQAIEFGSEDAQNVLREWVDGIEENFD